MMSSGNSSVNPQNIVEAVVESGCSLETILCMGDDQLTRAVFECKKWKKMELEKRSRLVAFAMSSDYLDNDRMLEQYGYSGRGPAKKKMTFLKTLEGMLEDPNVDSNAIKWFMTNLANQNLIDKKILAVLQRIFNGGPEKAVQILLDCDIDLHVKNKLNCDLKVHLFGNHNIDISTLLQNGKFDLNAKGKSGFSALHFATKKNIIANVEVLLEAGADPNSKDVDGESPLFVAQDDKCVALLLQYGSDIDTVCRYGYSCFNVISETSKTVLIAHFALMEAMGLSVKEEIRIQIFRDLELKNFYEEHRQQLEWMKKRHIKKSFTMFDALVESVEISVRYVKDETLIIKLIESCQTQQLFWYYTCKLENNLSKALAMHSLQNAAAQVIAESIIEFDYNHLVTKKIIDMLTFKDLQLFG